MNAKLLPEQRLLRGLGKILLFVLAWPLWLMSVYVDSDRYSRAAYDAFSDTVILLLSIVAEFAWIVFLFWLALSALANG